MRKNVLVMLTRSPAGRIHVIEGARIATGLTLEDHRSKLLFTERSVFAARKDYNDRLFNSFLEEIEQIYIDVTALKEHGIDESDLRPGVEVLAAEEVTDLVSTVEFMMTF